MTRTSTTSTAWLKIAEAVLNCRAVEDENLSILGPFTQQRAGIWTPMGDFRHLEAPDSSLVVEIDIRLEWGRVTIKRHLEHLAKHIKTFDEEARWFVIGTDPYQCVRAYKRERPAIDYVKKHRRMGLRCLSRTEYLAQYHVAVCAIIAYGNSLTQLNQHLIDYTQSNDHSELSIRFKKTKKYIKLAKELDPINSKTA